MGVLAYCVVFLNAFLITSIGSQPKNGRNASKSGVDFVILIGLDSYVVALGVTCGVLHNNI